MAQLYYFGVDSIINRTKADVLSFLHGRQMDLSREAIDDDDVPQLKRWLKNIASEVYTILHSLGTGIADSYVFDETITVDEAEIENQIAYTISFPDNYDENLISTVDSAIEEALINNLVKRFMFKRGYRDETIKEDAEKSYEDLKKYISFRKSLRRTYNMY